MNGKTERQKRIDAYRQSQPKAELRRKWEKSRGRYDRHYYTQEWLDWAKAEANELYDALFPTTV